MVDVIDTLPSRTGAAHAAVDSPIGRLHLYATDAGLVGCHTRHRHPRLNADAAKRHSDGVAARQHLAAATRELGEYFAGVRRTFGVPLDLPSIGLGASTERILAHLTEAVDYGSTMGYGALAERLGVTGFESDRSPAQRVGAALAANPLLIVVPCHRVVAANGSLTGYAGGLVTKRYLLDLERGQGSLDVG